MNEARGPLRLLGVAFAATGALLALQTLALRAIPYEADLSAIASAVFRCGFVVADLVAAIALLRLAPRAPRAATLFRVAALLVGASFFCGIVGALPRASGAIAGVLAGMEPQTTFGAMLLAALGFASMRAPTDRIDRRASSLSIAAITLVAAVFVFRLYTSMIAQTQGGAIAWLRWLMAVAQFVVLAVLSFTLAKNTESDPSATPAGVTGYRAAERIAETEIAAPTPPSSEMILLLSKALRGLQLQRTMVIVRIGASIGAFVILVGVPEGGVLVSSISGIATSGAILIAIRLQRSLATFRGGVAGIAAIVFFILSALSELAALAWIFSGGGRHSESALGLAVPAATFLYGTAILASSRVQERAGVLSGIEGGRLAARARWTQALVVVAATATLAFVNGAAALRHSSGSTEGAGAFIVIAFIAAFPSTFTAVGFHIATLSAAQSVIRARLDLAARVGSPPNP